MTSAVKSQRNGEPKRLRATVRGAVQGVGFRPFVYRLASELNLKGWVNNSSQGVHLEVEGVQENLKVFLARLQSENPPRSDIQSIESSVDPAKGFADFRIRSSEKNGLKSALVLPDIATCTDCLSEVFDPDDRRYLYPFTNCTHCGPRYSIIESLPYDRANTTMKSFTMCGECLSEYNDPANRRFHAQPNACPACGPKLQYRDGNGKVLCDDAYALSEAADAIRHGKIVAVKGLGGFHLLVDAANDKAVVELRKRKHREAKPLALMMPDVGEVKNVCDVSALEESLLDSPERPIVILKSKKSSASVSSHVAPGNPYLGCMLPYTPLHHLLMRELSFPVVATSGNLSDEPICIDEKEALSRLNGIADFFLVHDRPIVRHVDDSIVKVMAGREMILRRARGYSPLPIKRKQRDEKVLAVGAHLKNTIAASAGDQTFISQHIGDLETTQAIEAFENVIGSLDGLYEIVPEIVACDAHPDYTSTRFAQNADLPVVRVQHHYAHVLSCMAENGLEPPALGIAWDGTGFGDDGTIWGGEFLRIGTDGYDRVAHFRTFPLPGGEIAIREPRRSALGMLYSVFGERVLSMGDLEPLRAFNKKETKLLVNLLEQGINSPLTSSVGRLFDAVASIAGIRNIAGFEGQAAMDLEFCLDGIRTDELYDFSIEDKPNGCALVDWAPAIIGIVADVRSSVSSALISARFHNMLAETIVAISKRIGETAIALSGGCFQNKYLLERALRRLNEDGFKPYWHRLVPTNDGGIALGQTLATDMMIAQRDEEILRRSTGLCV
jgi:hydrogenase maturation protein HypF